MAASIKFAERGAGLGTIFRKASEQITAERLRAALRIATFAGDAIADSVVELNNESGKSTGALAKSFLPPTTIQGTGDTIIVGAISTLPYARIQDAGGEIKPKSGRNLAIPLSGEAEKRWPRDWKRKQPGKAPQPGELSVVKTKSGKALLGELFGKRPKWHYVLKPSVRIDGTGYIDHARKKVEPEAVEVIKEMLGDAWGES